MLRGAPQFLHFISETTSDNASFPDCSRIELMKAELSPQTDNGLHDNSSLCHIPRSPLRHIRLLSRPCHWISARSSRSFLHNTAPIPDWPSYRQTHKPSPLSCSW